ncbi:hypothetical protein PDJAM_G00041890, partial [Pangasius djambal]|nr:hypothetical protein [Pangasius djambal]
MEERKTKTERQKEGKKDLKGLHHFQSAKQNVRLSVSKKLLCQFEMGGASLEVLSEMGGASLEVLSEMGRASFEVLFEMGGASLEVLFEMGGASLEGLFEMGGALLEVGGALLEA